MPRMKKWFRIAIRHPEISFHQLHQSRFLRRLEGRLWEPWNIAWSNSRKSFLILPEGRLWVLMVIPLHKITLKEHRPSRFFGTPRFLKCMSFRHLETTLYRLLQNLFLRSPDGRLWILRHIRLHKISLKRFRPSRHFRCPGNTKWVRISLRHLETLLHRLHQSRFLRRPEGKLWVLRPIHPLKISLKRFRPFRFFWCPWRKKICSHGLSTPWNIASSTSPKSFFKTSRRQIMCSQAIHLLKTTLKQLRPSRFFDAQGAQNVFA
jgi:hypothetical protein